MVIFKIKPYFTWANGLHKTKYGLISFIVGRGFAPAEKLHRPAAGAKPPPYDMVIFKIQQPSPLPFK